MAKKYYLHTLNGRRYYNKKIWETVEKFVLPLLICKTMMIFKTRTAHPSLRPSSFRLDVVGIIIQKYQC